MFFFYFAPDISRYMLRDLYNAMRPNLRAPHPLCPSN